MRRISILNFKGGTGKSSLTENLGHAVARLGHKVLLVDGDRQSNTTITLLGKRLTPSLRDVMTEEATIQDAIKEARPNLFIIPSDTDLDRVATWIKDNHFGYDVIREAVEGLDDFYLVLIDHAGAFTPVMEALLLASSEILIPCELEPYSVNGIFDMQAKLEKQLRKHKLKNAGIIPYNVDLRYSMARQYLKELRSAFGDLVTAPVRTDSVVSKAQSVGMTVFEYQETYDVKSRAAEDFKALAEDLIEEAQEVTP